MKQLCVWLFTFTLLFGPVGTLTADESEILAEIAKLRGIQPTNNKEELERLNQNMDSAWSFLRKHRTEAAPIVARELRKELMREQLDQFLVLDTAYFLVSEARPDEDANTLGELALDALQHIDPKAEIIQYNFVEFVKFTHAVAKRGNPGVLPQIDRIFLESNRGIEDFDPPHYVKLPAQSIRVVLYGVTGPSVEDHLAKLLNEEGYEKYQTNIMALLCELGSEGTVDAVKQVLNTRGDYECFSMAVTMLMTLGGPTGRDAVVMAKTDHLDQKSRDYHARILAGAKALSFERLAAAVKKLDGSDRTFDDSELAKRLELMYENFGVDRETNPSNVVNSGLPKQELLTQLKRIRARMLQRMNKHGLEDVHTTNLIINAIQYKP